MEDRNRIVGNLEPGDIFQDNNKEVWMVTTQSSDITNFTCILIYNENCYPLGFAQTFYEADEVIYLCNASSLAESLLTWMEV